MEVITDRQATNEDVPFMRPGAIHQLHIWETCFRAKSGSFAKSLTEYWDP